MSRDARLQLVAPSRVVVGAAAEPPPRQLTTLERAAAVLGIVASSLTIASWLRERSER